MHSNLRKIGRFFVCLYDHFFDHHCPSRAAALAYTTLLSIIPLMLFVFYILSFVPQLQGQSHQIEAFILNNFVASSASVISKQLQVFLTHIQVLSWTNMASLGVISILLVYNMVQAVNEVWQVEMYMSLALSFLLYLALILVVPIIFSLVLLLTSYLTSLPFLSKTVELELVRKPILIIFPFLVEWVAFTIFNWLMPSVSVRLKYAALSGFITMVLFELAKVCFVQYLHYFPTYRLVYGALATIPIFLVWIYVSWLIILLGVLLCYLMQTKPYRQ